MEREKSKNLYKPYAGRRINFAPVKSLDSSDSDSKLSDLKVHANNVKLNPVIS